MENKNNFTADSNSTDKLIISYELLQLMEWFVENEGEALKKIISRSLKRGLDEQLKHSKNLKDLYTPEEMQNNIIDFLGLLEYLLVEITNEQEVNNILQKNMMPAIDHVDTANCDSNILKSSIAVASSKIQRNPKGNVQELFLKELLKRWKPVKNGCLN